MKSKILITCLLMIGISSATFAQQEYKSDRDLMQAAIGKSKQDFVSYYVTIPQDKNETFWKIYNKYEEARLKISNNRLALLQKYVNAYNDSMSYRKVKKEIKEDINKSERYTNEIQKHIKETYHKVFEQVSPQTALQFFVVETYLQNKASAKVLENLPF